VERKNPDQKVNAVGNATPTRAEADSLANVLPLCVRKEEKQNWRKNRMISLLIKKSIEAFKQNGIKGFIKAYKEHNLNYPPLHSHFWYWLNAKTHSSNTFTCQLDGYKMKLLYSDKGLSKQLFISGYREPECTRLIKEIVKPKMTIYDIGANMGYFAIMESKLVGQDGLIYAIEPQKNSYGMLKANIDLNNCTNIHTDMLTIGNKIGTTKLYKDSHLNRCSVLIESDNYQKIEMTTFDAYAKYREKPDIIRMDVEGYEYYIVDGMKNLFDSNQKCIIFLEVHPLIIKNSNLDINNMYKKFFDANFKPIHIIKKHGWLREEYLPSNINSFSEFKKFIIENQLDADHYGQGYGLFLERK